MKKIALLIISLFSFIHISKAEDITSAFFETLEISNGIMSPAFDKKITEYTVQLSDDETNLSIDYNLEDKYASMIIYGNEYLEMGLNEVIVKIIAADDETNINYKFLVTRSESEYVFEDDSTAVSLEIPVGGNIKEKYDNTAQIIASICFGLLLIIFGLLFGKRRINK